MSRHIKEDGWRIQITEDRSCLDCIVNAGDDDMDGVRINRSDKMISIYNHVLISKDECEAEGNHV